MHLSSLGKAAWYNAIFLVIAYTAMGMFFTLIAVAAKSLWASFTAHVVNNLLIYIIGIWAAVSTSSSMMWRSLTGTLLGMGIVAGLVYWRFLKKADCKK
nr:CPBP family glutamic-type intramembrane protease [uncultured Lactobacillus sp.]